MAIEKTIFIYDQCGQAEVKFFVLEGDYTELDGVYINSTEGEELIDKLNSALPDDKLLLREFPTKEVTENTAVIIVGFAG